MAKSEPYRQPDPAQALAAVAAERARRSGSRSLAAFVKQAWPVIDSQPLVWDWYLEAFCSHLEAVSRREILRFLGNMPPRHGKSNVFAILWPAWVWTWRPSEKFIYLSFGDDLVLEHSTKCRALVQGEWYQKLYKPGWRLLEDQNTKHNYASTAGGHRIASTIRRGVMGRGADCLCVDDPLSTEEVGSKIARDQATRVIAQAASTRLNDPQRGCVAIVMQRVAADDPSAWAIAAGYEHFCAPAEFDSSRCSVTHRVIERKNGHVERVREEFWRDPRQVEGELLSPDRMPVEVLARVKTSIGLAAYAAQYQQQPVAHPMAGYYFQRGWFDIVASKPSEEDVTARVRSWDLAATVGGGDWTVGVRVSRVRSGAFYIEDVVRGQWSSRAVRDTVLRTAQLDNAIEGAQVMCRTLVPQDPGQAGKDQAVEYASMLAGYVIETPPPKGTKEMRAGPASAQAQAKNIKIVVGRHVEEFLQTLEAFPDEGAHDDDVDALAGAIAAIAIQPKTTAELWAEVEL